jgi:hypothetical protein
MMPFIFSKSYYSIQLLPFENVQRPLISQCWIPDGQTRSLLRPDVAYRIRVLHNGVNFVKRLNPSRTTSDIGEQTTNLFDGFCYAKIEDRARAAIGKSRQLIPAMSKYLDREMAAILSVFAEAFRGDVLTLGYHSTSVSEGENRIVNRSLPSHIVNLMEI